MSDLRQTAKTAEAQLWKNYKSLLAEVERLRAENEELRKIRDNIVGDYINDGRVVYMRDSEVNDE